MRVDDPSAAHISFKQGPRGSETVTDLDLAFTRRPKHTLFLYIKLNQTKRELIPQCVSTINTQSLLHSAFE